MPEPEQRLMMNVQAALQQRAKVEEFQRKHRVVLLTLVFTDLVNSTQLKSDLGEERCVGVIQSYRALVRELMAHFKEAEEIETAGDSFFLVFAKPSDAARFSVRICSKGSKSRWKFAKWVKSGKLS